MIGPLSLRDLFGPADFIPQAVINRPVLSVARNLDTDFESGYDDFDEYEGVGIILDDTIQAALLHYQGHPEDTFTIYLSHEIEGIENITRTIARIVSELGIPETAIGWQRKDNPEL